MENNIYKDIAQRTDGDIYIGIVGPVRSGKSTFIKKFMENLVIPNIDSEYRRERAIDELPQSAAGKTIMTTEPKFIPEEAVSIVLEENANLNVRMIDCVGYIVPSALGYIENEMPRMVQTPWFEEEIPFNMAAEVGTQKVITEHSTIGLVITTDGSISDIPRDEYEEVEERVIQELKEINKPFVVLLNSYNHNSNSTIELANKLSEKYSVPVIPINCLELNESDIKEIMSKILFQFPIKEVSIDMPKWLNTLESEHWLKSSIFNDVKNSLVNVEKLNELNDCINKIKENENITNIYIENIDLGRGKANIVISINNDLFYSILSSSTGLEIKDESELISFMLELSNMKKEYEKIKCALDEVNATGYGIVMPTMDELSLEEPSELISFMLELSNMKKEYEKIKCALDEVNATGYGIVMPTMDELSLEEPEIIKQGGKYGVKLRASAPSIHMMKADITAEVNPIVGSEKQSEELVMYLLKEFEENPKKIWESNIFGKSLHELINEGLHNKLYRMPSDARLKLQETLERIINEGCGGLICILL